MMQRKRKFCIFAGLPLNRIKFWVLCNGKIVHCSFEYFTSVYICIYMVKILSQVIKLLLYCLVHCSFEYFTSVYICIYMVKILSQVIKLLLYCLVHCSFEYFTSVYICIYMVKILSQVIKLSINNCMDSPFTYVTYFILSSYVFTTVFQREADASGYYYLWWPRISVILHLPFLQGKILQQTQVQQMFHLLSV